MQIKIWKKNPSLSFTNVKRLTFMCLISVYGSVNGISSSHRHVRHCQPTRHVQHLRRVPKIWNNFGNRLGRTKRSWPKSSGPDNNIISNGILKRTYQQYHRRCCFYYILSPYKNLTSFYWRSAYNISTEI